MNDYYVYVLLDPRKPGTYKYGRYLFDFEPFYVGKGRGKRAFLHKKDKSKTWKSNLIQKLLRLGLDPIVVFKKKNLSNANAIMLEIKIISIIGRNDFGKGPLTNLTDGGEGNNPSSSSRQKRSQSLKNYWSNVSDNDRKVFGKKIRKTKLSDPDSLKASVEKAKQTRKNQSPEQRQANSERLSISQKESWHNRTPEEKQKFSEAASKGQLKRRQKENQSLLDAAADFYNLSVLDPYIDGKTKLLHLCLTCDHAWYRYPAYTLNFRHGCPNCNKSGSYAGMNSDYVWVNDGLKAFQLKANDPRINDYKRGRRLVLDNLILDQKVDEACIKYDMQVIAKPELLEVKSQIDVMHLVCGSRFKVNVDTFIKTGGSCRKCRSKTGPRKGVFCFNDGKHTYMMKPNDPRIKSLGLVKGRH